ncbi:hypothetical protein ASF14_19815 [Sphingomonas sp. Leaf257]|nr:hypothetical protein ASF14_19815 [Sphingomonas sp. Leaf257]
MVHTYESTIDITAHCIETDCVDYTAQPFKNRAGLADRHKAHCQALALQLKTIEGESSIEVIKNSRQSFWLCYEVPWIGCSLDDTHQCLKAVSTVESD